VRWHHWPLADAGPARPRARALKQRRPVRWPTAQSLPSRRGPAAAGKGLSSSAKRRGIRLASRPPGWDQPGAMGREVGPNVGKGPIQSGPLHANGRSAHASMAPSARARLKSAAGTAGPRSGGNRTHTRAASPPLGRPARAGRPAVRKVRPFTETQQGLQPDPVRPRPVRAITPAAGAGPTPSWAWDGRGPAAPSQPDRGGPVVAGGGACHRWLAHRALRRS